MRREVARAGQFVRVDLARELFVRADDGVGVAPLGDRHTRQREHGGRVGAGVEHGLRQRLLAPAAASFDEDRARSLEFRFGQERILLDRATELGLEPACVVVCVALIVPRKSSPPTAYL